MVSCSVSNSYTENNIAHIHITVQFPLISDKGKYTCSTFLWHKVGSPKFIPFLIIEGPHLIPVSFCENFSLQSFNSDRRSFHYIKEGWVFICETMQTQARKKYFHLLFDGQGTGPLHIYFSKSVERKKHFSG